MNWTDNDTLQVIGSFLGGMGLMYFLSQKKLLGSRNQILNRFQKGYQSILNDPYSYPETKEASLRVARGIMDWYKQNKSGNVLNDYDYTRYLENLADNQVNIGSILEQLNRG